MQFSFVAAIALFASFALAYPAPVPASDLVRRAPQTPSMLYLLGLIDNIQTNRFVGASDPSMIDAGGNLVDFKNSGVDTTYKSSGNSFSGN